MKTTRKIVSFEIETTFPIRALRTATIRLPGVGTIRYLNQPQVKRMEWGP